MARILAISSQVARGAIGLSAAIPALQALGHDVVALPTILLSNHPGHARFAGERVSPDLLRRMLDALEANGWLGEIDAVLTGYLPSADHVAVAAHAIERVRAIGTGERRAIYLCDPVIGDWPKGIYIDPAAAAAIRERLVPVADILTPNVFELGWLTGHDVVDLATTITAATACRAPTVVATSVPMSAGAALANVAVGPDRTSAWTSVPRRARVANGTGDLFAALLLGHRLRGSSLSEAAARASAGVEHVVSLSEGLEELALAPHLCGIADALPQPLETGGVPSREPATGPVWVAGVDGCRGGWMVVLRDATGSRSAVARIVPSFADVLALPERPAIIAVDMPIGLPDRVGIGGRVPDIEARRVLGQRQSSVFAVPARRAVMAADYRDACEIALATSEPPRKISKQTWNLFPRIREVDAVMTPELQQTVYECHPEVAFWAMNGERPLEEPKKVKSRGHEPGLDLRRRLLAAAGYEHAFLAARHAPGAMAGVDDFLDACACAWSAARILAKVERTFPDVPPRDGRGLRQEIKA